jgi:hypothetical protein
MNIHINEFHGVGICDRLGQKIDNFYINYDNYVEDYDLNAT